MKVNYKGMELPEKTAAAIRKYRGFKDAKDYVALMMGDHYCRSAFWKADTIEFLYSQTFPFYDATILETNSSKIVGAFYHGNVSSEELKKEE